MQRQRNACRKVCETAIRLCPLCNAVQAAHVTYHWHTRSHRPRRKGKEIMRKLLITAAAGAGLLMTTVAANAATPAGTYTHSQGSYSLCVTNNVVDSGATQMVQVDLGGLPKQDRKSTRLNSSHANISYAV